MRLAPDLEDQFRTQSLMMLDTLRSGMSRRLASLVIPLVLCWIAGETVVVGLLIAAALYTEIGIAMIRRQVPERVSIGVECGSEVPLGTILTFWLNSVLTLVLFGIPTLVLAAQPSVPLLICGLIWSLGLLVYMDHAFNSAPLYAKGHLVPAYGIVLLTIWQASGQTFQPAPGWHWVLVVGMGVFFGASTAQIRADQKAMVADLWTARAEAQGRLDRLIHLGEHDPLTGLLNRRAFDDRLESFIAKGGATVFLIDLDGFKPINDSYSHAAGDAALVAVAERLRAAVGGDGVIARLDGDEFAVCLDTADPGGRLEWLTDAMLTQIAQPIPFGKGVLHLTTSIGIADSRRVPGPVEALLGAADQAMFRAKSSGGDRSCRFEPGEFAVRATLKDRARLIEAMERGRIVAHYQPKVRLADGSIVGFEALARWVEPDGALRSPGEFLPQIRELGLTAEFTSRIARQVVRDVGRLRAAGFDPGQVSINLPEVSLTSLSGRKDILRILELDPKVTAHLTLEITEDVFIGRANDVVRTSIAAIRARGARVSLDDFGTGFASFQNLRQLDYDELKIDRSFIAGLGQDHSAEVLIGSFLTMAQGLGVDVVAEGVETADQRAALMRLGCSLGQGYLFGKAMPIAETEIRLQSRIPSPPFGAAMGRSPMPPPDARAAPGLQQLAAKRS